jgi:hypothetical protein
LVWRRSLFVWETGLLNNLLRVLEGFSGTDEGDSWMWGPEGNGGFSVKSYYRLLEKLFRYLWKSSASSKVVSFSWPLLLDCIPTRVNLMFRRVLNVDAAVNFVFCGGLEETSTHLFLHCDFISKVWLKVLNWLQIMMVTPPNLLVHFLCWSNGVRPRKVRRGFQLIWHAAIWIIWTEMNDCIFNNSIKEVDDLVEKIKALSWHWSLSRLKIASCLYYEWCWNTRDCMLR